MLSAFSVSSFLARRVCLSQLGSISEPINFKKSGMGSVITNDNIHYIIVKYGESFLQRTTTSSSEDKLILKSFK